MDGDGHVDMVAVHDKQNRVSVHRGIGDGTFPARVEIVLAVAAGGGIGQAAISDIDGDGYQDIVTPISRIPPAVSVLYGRGSISSFESALVEVPIDLGLGPILVEDFNDDARPDLAGAIGDAAWILLNACPLSCANEAELAEPFGMLNFSDVVAFLNAFGAGCP